MSGNYDLHSVILQPPIPVLNVTVIEATGLEAKDPNGTSDPYCMLGIQPDPDSEKRKQDAEEENNSNSGGLRGLKRFGASFKKRDRRDRSNSEILPAKLIRTTKVKPETLSPKWREKFRLDIDDIRSDRFHLDICYAVYRYSASREQGVVLVCRFQFNWLSLKLNESD
ncbi:BAI1-associated protein 3 [Araneus ventricosus]|uniref:BAI1-associated protein 3 n=1 Tax=Araneus ventricosus TaxID=182803 RepID=A0A4Y2AFK6_ARAVE|nr:BAI1-associated protein 3 [Araneus ventricosus]